jgi:hypothetical protein
MCPSGRLNGAIADGLGIRKAWLAVGWASAAAPVHGSAAAGGATTPATINPTAAAEATDTDAIRRRGDMSHLSQGTSHGRHQLLM